MRCGMIAHVLVMCAEVTYLGGVGHLHACGCCVTKSTNPSMAAKLDAEGDPFLDELYRRVGHGLGSSAKKYPS